jgi:hypothetical protein
MPMYKLILLGFLVSLMSFPSQLEYLLSWAEFGSGARLVNELIQVGSLTNKYLQVDLSRVELARYPPLVKIQLSFSFPQVEQLD